MSECKRKTALRGPLLPALLIASLAGLHGAPAKAEMVLDKVVVDLGQTGKERQDIEVWNAGSERIYVLAELSEILDPGTPAESRRAVSDPEVSGLFISPLKMILEADERRIIRIVAVGPRQAKDRIYRLAVKPVAGPVLSDESALKIFVGYDALVLYRPEKISGTIQASFEDGKLVLENHTNTAQSLFEGRQCDGDEAQCVELPSKRLYAGASWIIDLPYNTKVQYYAQSGDQISQMSFDPAQGLD